MTSKLKILIGKLNINFILLFLTFCTVALNITYTNFQFSFTLSSMVEKYECDKYGIFEVFNYLFSQTNKSITFVDLNIIDYSKPMLINYKELSCVGKVLINSSKTEHSVFLGYDSYLNNYFYIMIKILILFLFKNKIRTTINLNFLIEFLTTFLLMVKIDTIIRIFFYFFIFFNYLFIYKDNYIDEKKLRTNQKNISKIILLSFFILFLQKIFKYEYLIGYWLTNYEYGFIRRGLLGHFLLLIHKISNIPIIYLINIFLIFIYSILVYYIFFFFNKKSRSLESYYILLSPSFLFFIIYDEGVIGRPEILGIITFLYFLKNFQINNKTYIYSSIFLSISIFTHSINILILPFLIYVLIKNYGYKKLKDYYVMTLFFIITVSFLSLILLIQSNLDNLSYILNNLCLDAENLNLRKDICNGAISYLSQTSNTLWDMRFFWSDKSNIYFITYIILIILALLPFEKTFWKESKLNLLILVFVLNWPIYYSAIDWGRFIWIYIFIISVIYLNDYEPKYKYNNKLNFSAVFVYSTIWFLPVSRGLRLDNIFTNIEIRILLPIIFMSIIFYFSRTNNQRNKKNLIN